MHEARKEKGHLLLLYKSGVDELSVSAVIIKEKWNGGKKNHNSLNAMQEK